MRTAETAVDLDSHIYRLRDQAGSHRARDWARIVLQHKVHVIIFLAAMSDYDQTLREVCNITGSIFPLLFAKIHQDSRVNSMNESLQNFKNLMTAEVFETCAVLLCFTKMDLFKKKIVSGASPLQDYYSEYAGEATDVVAAQAFFTDKFKKLNVKKRVSSIHYLNLFDTEDIGKLVEDLKGVRSRFRRQRDYELAIQPA